MCSALAHVRFHPETGHSTSKKADAIRLAPASPCSAANLGDCLSNLRIYGIARTRAFRALPAARRALARKAKTDNETPAEVTRRIAKINRL
jgi:hypothetical protein